MSATASSSLDALPREAQRFFVARCVAFACALLERGESLFADSATLAGFRRDFSADLQSFSEQLWQTLPPSGRAAALADRLRHVLDVQDKIPTGVDKLDGRAQDSIFIVLTTCLWSTEEKGASAIARMTSGLLRGVGIQEALAIAGRKTMRGKDVDVSQRTDPELKWQAAYVDRAQNGSLEQLERFAKDSANTLIEELVPKINAAAIRSRS